MRFTPLSQTPRQPRRSDNHHRESSTQSRKIRPRARGRDSNPDLGHGCLPPIVPERMLHFRFHRWTGQPVVHHSSRKAPRQPRHPHGPHLLRAQQAAGLREAGRRRPVGRIAETLESPFRRQITGRWTDCRYRNFSLRSGAGRIHRYPGGLPGHHLAFLQGFQHFYPPGRSGPRNLGSDRPS